MATLSKLITLVENVLQDSTGDYTQTVITDYLNQGVREIAGGVLLIPGIGNISLPLPDLFTIGTVEVELDEETETVLYPYVSLPTDYQRDLVQVIDSGGTEILIYDSFLKFSKSYPLLNSTGSNISYCAVKGSTLYFQPIPSAAKTLTVHYHRLPTDMSDPDDEPDGIPTHLQIPLLVNYVAKELFNLIEDGIAEPKINTNKHEAAFNRAMMTLEMSIPVDGDSLFIADSNDYPRSYIY